MIKGTNTPKFANGNPVGEIFPTYVHRCEVSGFPTRKLQREIISTYVIEDRVWKTGKGGIHEYLTPKRRLYNCEHNIVEKEIRCSCKMFETHGILCRHVIRVMDMNLYEEPPEKYVLRRWRKDIRRKHAVVEVCYHDPAKTERTKRFDKMNAVFDALAFESCGCERTCDIVMKGLKRISDEVRSYNVVHVDEGGGMRGVGDIDSVHSSEPIGSNTQRTAVSGTLHGEQPKLQLLQPTTRVLMLWDSRRVRSPVSALTSFQIQDRVNKLQQWYVEIVLYRRKKVGQKVLATKSPGEKGWKKANENGSKNGGTGVNRGCKLRFEFDRELKTSYML
ncbi:Protein FAR1-RELATED SEQUENCE 6 [Bienertia sinuspersici]